MSEEPEGASSPMPAEEEPRGLRARRPQNVNRMRLMQRRMRELQLASEGAFSLLFNLSLREAFERLVDAGLEWEDQYTSAPPGRRRVPLESEPTKPDS